MKKRTHILVFVSVMMILSAVVINGCKKDNTDPQSDIELGANYEGGIIFYIDGTGNHGLIAASADLSRMTPWWNGSFILTGAISATNGSQNTTAIISAQGNTGTYAAKICRDYRGGGKSDWFLPSKDQLNTLYSKKEMVGGFASEIYWSSTEADLGSAWVQYFLDGEQWLDNTSDGATVGTRAIRAF